MKKSQLFPFLLALLLAFGHLSALHAGVAAETGGALYVNTGKLKLLYEAMDDGSAQTGEIQKDQAFTLLQREGKWALVAYVDLAGQERQGYIRDAGLKPQGADHGQAYILSDDGASKVPLRRSTGKNGTVIAKYHSGVLATLLEEPGEKVTRVRVGSLTGYIDSGLLVEELPASASLGEIPEADVLNPDAYSLSLREAPDYKSQKLRGYPNGARVKILGVTEGFAHVLTADGRSGFMMASGLTPQPVYADLDPADFAGRPSGYTSVIDNQDGQGAHLRRKGSTASESMGLYKNGTEVVVYGGTAWWKQVWVDGKTGYMMARLIRGFVPTEGDEVVEPPIDWTLEEFQNPPGWDGVDAPEGN